MLQAIRKSPEAKCAQYLAVDRFPCFDKTTCVKAAQANPQTTTMINAEGFWEAMVDWQAQRAQFNTSINALQTTLNAPISTPDYARQVNTQLGGVRMAFDSFMHNNLYRNRYDADCTKYNRSTCFEYCTRTNWSQESDWSASESQWFRVAASLDGMSGAPARAQAIANSTAQWLNYSKSKAALWSAMDKEMTDRQNRLVTSFSSASASWNDTALASNIIFFKQSLNDTRTLAASGRIRAALATKSALTSQSDALMDGITLNQQRALHIQNSLKSITLAVASLNRSGSNQSAQFASSLAALNAAALAPIPATQLQTLESQSSQLEQLTLAEVARASLGAPPSAQDAGAAAQVIVPTGANGGANATANASNASNSPSAPLSPGKPSLPSPLQCALPAVGIVMLLGLATVKLHNKKSDM